MRKTHSTASGVQGSAWYFIAGFNLFFSDNYHNITRITKITKLLYTKLCPKKLILESIPAFDWR